MNKLKVVTAGFLFVLSLILGGCPGGSGTGPVQSDRETYPQGSYGLTEGDALENLSFTTFEGNEWSFDADVFKDVDAQLLLLTTAAGWCSSCIEEQPSLQALHEKHYDAGLRVVVSLFEDSNFTAATVDLAAAWQATHDLDFDVLVDEPFALSPYYDESLTPMVMLVDVNFMEILSINTGWDASLVEAIIESTL
ncbi:MAG: redoxin domain-containing protein [Deltaproteobacteria bacterium]|nr:redoxin domain-containing protein [Deltaproteobacteria bacterium]